MQHRFGRQVQRINSGNEGERLYSRVARWSRLAGALQSKAATSERIFITRGWAPPRQVRRRASRPCWARAE